MSVTLICSLFAFLMPVSIAIGAYVGSKVKFDADTQYVISKREI